MTSNNVRRHESWVDWAKVLLIYLVIVCHAGDRGPAQDFINAFHMPAFFVVSGYLYRQKDWKLTCRRLLTPVVFYSAVCLLFRMGMEYALSGEVDLQRYATSCWAAYYTAAASGGESITLFVGVWFIVVLLFSRLLLGDLPALTFVRRYYGYIALAMMTWVVAEPMVLPAHTSAVQDLYVYRTLSCFPFMALGLWLQEHPGRKDAVLKAGWPWLLMLALLYVVLTLENGEVSVWGGDYGKDASVYFVDGAVASLLLFMLCSRLKPWSVIETLSRGTLLILGVHYMWIIVVYTLCRWAGIDDWPITPWLTALSVFPISYYPIRFFVKHKIPLV